MSKINIDSNYDELVYTIGESTGTINGQTFELRKPPIITDGVTMVPLKETLDSIKNLLPQYVIETMAHDDGKIYKVIVLLKKG